MHAGTHTKWTFIYLLMDLDRMPEVPPTLQLSDEPKSPLLSVTDTAQSRGRSPIPPDSPLLNKTPASPQLQRARQIHRELSRARNFRASLSRENSRGGTPRNGSRIGTPSRGSRCGSPTRGNGEESALPVNKAVVHGELSFTIRPSIGGRKGWKIMPEDDGAIEDGEIIKRVVEMIKEMEFSGHTVPERITIKV